MLQKNKLLVYAALLIFVWLGVAAVRHPYNKERNLQVLPKDISDKKLDSIMLSYNAALGVDCKFCHQPANSLIFGSKDSLDFASDKNPMKENARDMMRMVIDINKTYFYFDTTQRPEYLHTVTCITCHRGQPMPHE
ncbi:MAG: c-type cytochrome [Sphingobacteriales bacterium]|nr:c-type cytochrome [Sphingobacteriales bacterium]